MTYTLSTSPTMLRHFSDSHQPYVADAARRSAAADHDDDFEAHLSIEARLRSGDYFVTLATELDQVAAQLASQEIPEAVELERLSAELAYLDKYYRLQSK